MSLTGLFFLFMYIGAATIGGGLVSVTLMQQELVQRSLISAEQFVEMIAVSESTPGPIGINMATYIGYELHGTIGSIVVTAGMVFPSFIIIVLISHFAASFQKARSVQDTMYGLRAGATGMISAAVWNIFALAILTLPRFDQTGKIQDICDWKSVMLFAVFLAIQMIRKNIHPIILIFAGGVAGVLFF